MSRLDRMILAASVLMVVGSTVFLLNVAIAQTPDVQRQLDRLDRDVTRLEERLEGTSPRLAAVEREVELNRLIIYGLIGTILGNFVLATATFRRVSTLANGKGRATP